MNATKNMRPALVAVALLGIVVLGATVAGIWLNDQPPADLPASACANDDGICETAPEIAICAADWILEDAASMTAPGGPCADCPRKPKGPSKCSRLSCDPCCYACVGEPLPLCLN